MLALYPASPSSVCRIMSREAPWVKETIGNVTPAARYCSN